MRVFSNINCPLKLKNAYMYFYFNPFSVQDFTFYDVPLHFNAHAIYIMQIDFAEFYRGQSVTAAKHA